MAGREWTQDEIDAAMGDCDNDEEVSDEEMAMEECGRWRNARLNRYCTKAGSEECDWICPLNSVRE